MSRPRLLVTGASGFLGAAVMRLARDAYKTLGTYHARPCPAAVALDLTDARAVQRVIADFQPQAIIHTAYDKTRADVIADGSTHVAAAAARCGARPVHLSTDPVFDGKKGAYTEDDPTGPLMPYGVAKLAAEQAVSAACPPAVLVRTSLIWTGRQRCAEPTGAGRRNKRATGGPVHRRVALADSIGRPGRGGARTGRARRARPAARGRLRATQPL